MNFINKLAEVPVFRFFLKNKSVLKLILVSLLLFPVIPEAWIMLMGFFNDIRPFETWVLLLILVVAAVLAVINIILIVFAIILFAKKAKKG